MSHTHRAVEWNRQKLIYDVIMLPGILLYLVLFVALSAYFHPTASKGTLLLRALATCAFLLLSLTLAIGPMVRIWPNLVPLLYNRRHLGVATFFVALAHGSIATIHFHGFSDLNPLVSLLSSNTRIDSVAHFPFELLGVLALLILLLLTVTSHDFWLFSLTPPVWKALHMCVYFAYALVVGHVLLGALQAERNPALIVLLTAGVGTVLTLHLISGFRESRLDRNAVHGENQMVDVCAVDEIAESRARIICVSGERVAIFRYNGLVSAISNVCRHQNGPLGEGKIIDGCVTCPWHGYQYRPETGASPTPYTDKVSTYRTQIVEGRVRLDPKPLPPGTFVEPARIANEG